MADLENIDEVHILKDTFCETGDLDYLDTAIALTAEIISASSPTDIRKILQPLMASLLEMKSSATQPVQEPVLVTPITPATQPVPEPVSLTSTIDMEVLSAVQTLKETFIETGDFDYLDNAIDLIEEIIEPSSPTDVKTILLPLLASLLAMKFEPASATLPVQEPGFVRSPTVDGSLANTLSTDRVPISQMMKDMRVTRTLLRRYFETGDSRHLDNGIANLDDIISAQDPTRVSQRHQPNLASHLEMKSQPESVTHPVQEPVSVTSRTFMADFRVVTRLVGVFFETFDRDYLDNAIALIKELMPASAPANQREIVQPMLVRLLEMQSLWASALQPVQEPMPVKSTTIMQDLRLFRTARATFFETDHRDDLESAIALTINIIQSSSPTDVTRIFLPLLASLLDMRSEPESATQPTQEPMIATSTTSAIQPVEKRILVTPTTVDDSPGKTRSTNPVIASQLVENLNAVQTLVETFRETGDGDYLDSAVAVMLELIEANPSSEDLQELLANMLEIEPPTSLAGQGTEHAPTEGIDAAFETVINTVPDSDEIADTLEIVSALEKGFDSTGEIDYIDSAIGITEDLIATTPDGERRRPFIQCYLSRLYYRRSINGQDVGDLDNKLVGSEEARVRDLERAIAASSAALAGTTPDYKLKAATLYFRSQLVKRRFKLLGVLEDLHNAILGNEEAVNMIVANEEAVANDPATKQDMLSYLGWMLFERFELLGASKDLDKAISVTTECVAQSLTNDPARANHLLNLSLRHYIRFQRLAVLGDLQNSILAMEEAVAIAPSTNPLLLSYLGVLLSIRYNLLGALEDLDESITVSTKSVAVTPADHPMRAYWLHVLSHSHYQRYERSGQVGDIDAAILAAEESVALTPFSNADMLSNQGALLTNSCDRLGNVADGEKSIARAFKATTQPASGDSARISRLLSFSNALFRRFEAQQNIEDMQSAIASAEEALAMASLDYPGRAAILINISTLVSKRHEFFGAPEDHINAMQAAEDAVGALKNTPDQSITSNNLTALSRMLGSRDDLFGRSGKIDESILMGEKALTASNSRFKTHGYMLGNLSYRFYSRFKSEGALADLEKSIELAGRAVATTFPGDVSWICYVNMLGAAYFERYRRSGSGKDLVLLSELSDEMLRVTADGPMEFVSLSMAGIVAKKFFDLCGARFQIDKAIWFCERAVDLIPARHVGRSLLLGNLSSLLRRRFERFKEVKDLERGIQMAVEAVALSQQHHLPEGNFLMQLGNILDIQETEYGPPTLDDNASVPGPSSGQPIVMFPRCLDVRLETLNLPLSSSTVRIDAARSAARILVRDCSWEHASSLLADAVKLLPTIAPQFLTREDQEQKLSNVVGLASDTMSVALQAGCTAAHSLSLLELGRGIIMSFAIDCRSDLSDLRVQHPELFNKLNALRIEIDTPLHMIHGDSDGLNDIDARRRQDEDRRCRRLQAQEEIEKILSYIHQLPGFEGFQQPPNPEDLMNMAAEGPIVICNCNPLRSDAIIVTATAIRSLSLPGLVYSEIPGRISQFTRLSNGSLRTSAKRNMDMAKELVWLWEAAVEPVLEELGLGATNEREIESKLPRIWWIGVGLLARAPFHAAGDHSRGSTQNTISRVISSYIPTIQALLYSRQKKLAIDTNPRLLFVAMPTTPETPAILAVPATRGIDAIAGCPPIAATKTAAAVPRINATSAIYRTAGTPGSPAKKWKPLKGALKEINQIVAVTRESSATVEVGYDPDSTAPTIILDSPSVTLVLQKLPAYQVIHFACHGVSDAESPSNSHLILLGDSSSAPGKLTVDAIASMNIEKAQIAYLSACSTADNASIYLADESIHIASGFLLAGFSHVLAALWPANDEACRLVAVDFYRRLLNTESRGVAGHNAVSTAFHQAVKALRDNNLGQPIMWACFVHTGA